MFIVHKLLKLTIKVFHKNKQTTNPLNIIRTIIKHLTTMTKYVHKYCYIFLFE